MPKIPDDIIRTIEERARIEEVVGAFLKLRKIGVRYTAICPFHDDHTDGNFIVYPKENCFRCFTCDAKGGAVQFLMDYLKLSFVDAIRWLGKKYNEPVDDVPFNYTPPPPRPKPAPLRMLTLPFDMVTSREDGREENTLVAWLRNGIGWDHCQRQRIDKVLDEKFGFNAENVYKQIKQYLAE